MGLDSSRVDSPARRAPRRSRPPAWSEVAGIAADRQAPEQSGPDSVDFTVEPSDSAEDSTSFRASETDASSGTSSTLDVNKSQELSSVLVSMLARSDASLLTSSQDAWTESTASW